MSSPPPSPHLPPDVQLDAVTCAAIAHTPTPHTPAAGVRPSSPVSSNKRHSSNERDGTVSGANSPAAKRVDGRPSPQRRTTIHFDPRLPTPMQIEAPDTSDLDTEIEMEIDQPTPSESRLANTTVTPSPNVDPTTSSAKPKASKKAKKKVNRPKKLVLDNSLLKFIRNDVFDHSQFRNKEVYTRAEMDKFDRNYQTQLLFNFAQKRASKKRALADEGRASRSASLDDLDYNNAAFHVESTNFQELSRYILEDLLQCKVGDKFLLCLPADSGSIHSIDLTAISKEQTLKNVGGDKCKISGRDYYCLKVAMDYAPNHTEIGLGMTEAQFGKMFEDRSGGFRVSFLYTDVKLMFKWYDILNNPRDIMLFGKPFATNRPLDYLFINKTNLQYIHHIFRHLADQFYGDSRISALLYAAYQKKRSIIFEKTMNEAL